MDRRALAVVLLSLHAVPLRATAVPLAVAPGDLASGSQPWPIVLPIRDCFDRAGQRSAQAFFGLNTTSVLPSFAVSAWKDRGTLYTEVVRDTGLCAQLSLAAAVAQATESKAPAAGAGSAEAAQRLLSAGGNLVLKGDLPLLYYRVGAGSPKPDEPSPDKNTWVGIFFAPRMGLDAPGMSETRDFAGSVDLGLEAQGTYSTDNCKFTFYFGARSSWTVGSKNWADALGLAQRSFWSTQAEVSVSVAQLFTVSVKGILDAPRSIRDAAPGALLTFSTGLGLPKNQNGATGAVGGGVGAAGAAAIQATPCRGTI